MELVEDLVEHSIVDFSGSNLSSRHGQCIICRNFVPVIVVHNRVNNLSTDPVPDTNNFGDFRDKHVKVEPVDTEGDTADDPFYSVFNKENEDALLKLLDVKISDSEYPPFSFVDVASSSNHSNSSYYCRLCASRNQNISDLFRQIETLHQNLSLLKKGVEEDFTCSFIQSCNISRKTVTRPDFLRYHIAKSLNLVQEPLDESVSASKNNFSQASHNSDSDNDNDDDWQPTIIPNIAYSDGSGSGGGSDSEHISNPLFHPKYRTRSTPRSKLTRSRQAIVGQSSIDLHSHGIKKDLIILVEKLPPHILSKYGDGGSDSGSDLPQVTTTIYRRKKKPFLRASARTKRVKARARYTRAKVRPTRPKPKFESAVFKCIFDDCPATGKIFKTRGERNRHVKTLHGQILRPPSSDDEETKEKDTPSEKFKCIFADCKVLEFYRTKEIMHAHIKAVHGIDMDAELEDIEDEDDENDKDGGCNNNAYNNADDEFLGGPPSPISSLDAGLELRQQIENLSQKNADGGSTYQCIFADCGSQETFTNLKDRDDHVKTVHSEAVTPKDTLEEKGTTTTTTATTTSVTPKRKKKKRINSPKIQSLPRLHCFVEGCKSRRYFASEAEREMHMKKIHEGVTHPFQCPECPRTYRSNQERDVHYKSIHLGEFQHMCHFCGKGFTSIANLNAHIPKHTQERNFKCDICDHSCKTQSGLVYHRRIHMGEVERNHRCDRCGKGFLTAVKLNNHIKCVHNKTEKPIICEICGKGFPIRNYLLMHMKVHRQQGKQSRDADDESAYPPNKPPLKRKAKSKALQNPDEDFSKQEPDRYLFDNPNLHSNNVNNFNSYVSSGSGLDPNNAFSSHSNSNSNLSSASPHHRPHHPGDHPSGKSPVDLSSHFHLNNFPGSGSGSSHPPRPIMNVSGHGTASANIPQYLTAGSGSSSGHQGSNVLPIQVQSTPAAVLQHQYLHIMNNFDNLSGGFHPKF